MASRILTFHGALSTELCIFRPPFDTIFGLCVRHVELAFFYLCRMFARFLEHLFSLWTIPQLNLLTCNRPPMCIWMHTNLLILYAIQIIYFFHSTSPGGCVELRPSHETDTIDKINSSWCTDLSMYVIMIRAKPSVAYKVYYTYSYN